MIIVINYLKIAFITLRKYGKRGGVKPVEENNSSEKKQCMAMYGSDNSAPIIKYMWQQR